MSNPSPGTKTSTPEFGCELFVAQGKHDTRGGGGNKKLFTAIHRVCGIGRPKYFASRPVLWHEMATWLFARFQ